MADKNIRQEEEECRKFLGIAGDDLAKKDEIKKCYNYITLNYLKEKFSDLLRQLDIKKEEKEIILKQLPNNIKGIIENINSSYQCLTSSMDINEFIKVKKVKDSQFKSEIIKGFAMTKGAFSKVKGINRENSKILILDFDLNEHDIKEPFVNTKKKENNKKEHGKNDSEKVVTSWADDVYKEISSLNINVILINKGIDNKLLEKFIGDNKIIAINVKSNSLEKIARCTKGKVYSSLEEFKNYINYQEIDKNKKQNIYGSCLFDIVEIKKFTEEKIETAICFDNIEDYKPDIFEKIIYRPKFKLMKFESKNNDYFRTLLIKSSNKILLNIIKKALKEEIFITVRDFYLQQKVLHFLFCKVEFVLPVKEEEKEKEKKINNNVSNKVVSKTILLDNRPGTIKRKIELQNEKKKMTVKEKVFEKVDESLIKKLDELVNDKKNINSNNENKENNKPNKKTSSQNIKVNNITVIENSKEEPDLATTPQFTSKKKPLTSKTDLSQESTIIKKDFVSAKEINTMNENMLSEIKKEENINNNKSTSNNSGNLKNFIYDEKRNSEISNFSLGPNENDEKDINSKANITEKISINLNLQEKPDFDKKQNIKYQFGFDISIINKDEKKSSNFNLLKLKMCKGKKNSNIEVADASVKKSESEEQLKIKNEAELMKKLNFICGKPENLELLFYESNSKEQKDKQFGKFIIEMIVDKFKKCEKCKNLISKHFFYLYNSDYSRIKISYISKEDSNLGKIIEYLKNIDFKDFKYVENITQINEIDYNIDIFSYGVCKKCKKIVTPLVKMPKDFFAFSTAEFFKHIINNSTITNRKDVEYNLINSFKGITENIFGKDCDHSSFHEINRIFLTKYGSIKFEYDSKMRYEILSVQKMPDNEDYLLKEKKSTSNHLRISENRKEDKDKTNNIQLFIDIIDLLGNKLKLEKEEIGKIIEIEKGSDIKGNVDSLINLLNDLIDYISLEPNKDSNLNISEKENSDNKTNNSQTTQRISIALSNESKELTMNFIEQITTFPDIEGSKKLGLRKRLAFRVAQLKVLYNKIRLIMHKIKIYISLEQILTKQKKINNNNNDISKNEKDKKEKEKNNDNEKIDNIDNEDLNEIKNPFQLKPKQIDLGMSKQKSISQPTNKTPKFEKFKSMPYETIIKKLIDNYVDLSQLNEGENKEVKSSQKYKEILDTILFYEEQPNDYSSIIKENDLSSIVSYAISSLSYKNFLKDKTNLFEIKKNENSVSNTNSTHSILAEKEKEKEREKEFEQRKLYQELYNSLLIFDSSNFALETEILDNEETSPKYHPILLKSINQEKFYPSLNSMRKGTISKQTMGVPYNSPLPFSPVNPSEEAEKKLGIIEDRISNFFKRIDSIRTSINDKIKKEIKLKKGEGDFYTALKNVEKEYKLKTSDGNKEKNNSSEELKMIRKTELLENFINSAEEPNKTQNAPFQQNPNRSKSNLGHIDNKEEDVEEFINIIELIGNLSYIEDYLPKKEIEITIYFPKQFEALRMAYCSTYEDLLASIMESTIWKNVSGGKSKAKFYKTKDEKYLFKSIKQNEFSMFIEMAPSYFHHMCEYLFHKMPSLLMKILGVFKIRIKKEENGSTIEENYFLMMMENLSYGLKLNNGKITSYDLKGSELNRYIKKTDLTKKNNVVLHDNNFKEDFNNEPIPLNKKIYDLLLISVYNDTLFLSSKEVVDYSLLLHIYTDNEKKINYLRMGIIDYIRKYTWDKQLEHYFKVILNGFVVPTIIKPNKYKERFQEAIEKYFIGV